MGSQMSGSQSVDVGAVVNRLMRLVRMDTSVFDEVRDREAETIPALIVAAVATVLSSIGGWLWVAGEVEGADTGEIVVRMVVLGSVFGFALWLAWALIAQVLLARGRPVDRMAIIRCMGYASAPAALGLLILIPSVSFGVVLIAIAAWFSLTQVALSAAVPDASPGDILVANLAGFAVWAIVLALLADAEGWAPGFFVHYSWGNLFDVPSVDINF